MTHCLAHVLGNFDVHDVEGGSIDGDGTLVHSSGGGAPAALLQGTMTHRYARYNSWMDVLRAPLKVQMCIN
jgi:hypothetical protein